jgi:hypothetical protein
VADVRAARADELVVLSAIERAAATVLAGMGVDAACAHARARGHAAITLTTFRDVAWNGPWYARNGFAVVDDPDQEPELRAIRASETARGLDALPRVAMRRVLV